MIRNVVLVLVVAGCTGGSGGVAGGNVPKEQYNTEAYKAICAHYASCGIAKSTDSCFQYYQSLLGSYASVGTNFYDKSIEEKKIAYDGAAAARCLNGYASASCSLSALLTPAADCRSIYVGQVPVGSECKFAQCVPAAFCTSEVDGKCPGTCKARVQSGGAATSPAECELGLTIVSGKCAQPPKEGEACVGTFGGCAAGLTCASDSKTCVKPKIAGDACSSTAPCDIFYSCVNGKCTAPADVSEPCGGGSTSGLGCKLELYCNITGADGGTCAAKSGEGTVCTSSSACNFDLRCSKATPNATDKTCHKPTPLNGACTTAQSTDCDTGLFCSSSSMTCVKQLEAGAACATGDVCNLGTCTMGKCVSYLSSVCF